MPYYHPIMVYIHRVTLIPVAHRILTFCIQRFSHRLPAIRTHLLRNNKERYYIQTLSFIWHDVTIIIYTCFLQHIRINIISTAAYIVASVFVLPLFYKHNKRIRNKRIRSKRIRRKSAIIFLFFAKNLRYLYTIYYIFKVQIFAHFKKCTYFAFEDKQILQCCHYMKKISLFIHTNFIIQRYKISIICPFKYGGNNLLLFIYILYIFHT